MAVNSTPRLRMLPTLSLDYLSTTEKNKILLFSSSSSSGPSGLAASE